MRYTGPATASRPVRPSEHGEHENSADAADDREHREVAERDDEAGNASYAGLRRGLIGFLLRVDSLTETPN